MMLVPMVVARTVVVVVVMPGAEWVRETGIEVAGGGDPNDSNSARVVVEGTIGSEVLAWSNCGRAAQLGDPSLGTRGVWSCPTAAACGWEPICVRAGSSPLCAPGVGAPAHTAAVAVVLLVLAD